MSTIFCQRWACNGELYAYENTWNCGELKLYFSPSAGGLKKKKKEVILVRNNHFVEAESRPYQPFNLFVDAGPIYTKQFVKAHCFEAGHVIRSFCGLH